MKIKNLIWLMAVAMMLGACQEEKTNTPVENVEPLWAPSAERCKIVSISDTHLAMEDAMSKSAKSRESLVDFLKRLRHTTDVSELVLVGDLLEGWAVPFTENGPNSDTQIFEKALECNKMVFDELSEVIKAGIKVVYVHGNHDMSLTHTLLAKAVPGITLLKSEDDLVYTTGQRNEVAFEHGNRFCITTAPDYLSNKGIAPDNFKLPFGWFILRMTNTLNCMGALPENEQLTESMMPEFSLERVENFFDNIDLIAQASSIKKLILKEKAHISKEVIDMPILKFQSYGFKQDYSLKDIWPQNTADGKIKMAVYPHFASTWKERQKAMGLTFTTDFLQDITNCVNLKTFAMDYNFNTFKIVNEYFPAQGKAKAEIVVQGHTHEPAYFKVGDKMEYVNDGCWLDTNDDYPAYNHTFVVVTSGKETSKADVYYYDTEGKLKDIKEEVTKKKEAVYNEVYKDVNNALIESFMASDM